MESKNNKFDGFHNEELDPIVFAEAVDSPELRTAALSIPRPLRDEENLGPKKSRAELLVEQPGEDRSEEWVPLENEKPQDLSAKNKVEMLYQIFGKVILFALPIGIIGGFLFYAASSL
jgi:hypothetical protein